MSAYIADKREDPNCIKLKDLGVNNIDYKWLSLETRVPYLKKAIQILHADGNFLFSDNNL